MFTRFLAPQNPINGYRMWASWGDCRCLSLPKMLSAANAFEFSDIERLNIGSQQPGKTIPAWLELFPRL